MMILTTKNTMKRNTKKVIKTNINNLRTKMMIFLDNNKIRIMISNKTIIFIMMMMIFSDSNNNKTLVINNKYKKVMKRKIMMMIFSENLLNLNSNNNLFVNLFFNKYMYLFIIFFIYIKIEDDFFGANTAGNQMDFFD
jgi:hypothetical protein